MTQANPILHSKDLTINRPKPLVEDIPVLEYSQQVDPRYAVVALLE